MTDSEQSDSGLITREGSAGDLVVAVRMRCSAFSAMTKGGGLPVNGTMQLILEEDKQAYAICVWSASMPDWPDPVPGNAAAAAEKGRRS